MSSPSLTNLTTTTSRTRRATEPSFTRLQAIVDSTSISKPSAHPSLRCVRTVENRRKRLKNSKEQPQDNISTIIRFISYTNRYSGPENLDQSRPRGYLLLNALLPLRIIGLIGLSLSSFHLAVAHPSTFPFHSPLTCHQERAEHWWASRSPAPLQEYSVERYDWYWLELFS